MVKCNKPHIRKQTVWQNKLFTQLNGQMRVMWKCKKLHGQINNLNFSWTMQCLKCHVSYQTTDLCCYFQDCCLRESYPNCVFEKCCCTALYEASMTEVSCWLGISHPQQDPSMNNRCDWIERVGFVRWHYKIAIAECNSDLQSRKQTSTETCMCTRPLTHTLTQRRILSLFLTDTYTYCEEVSHCSFQCPGVKGRVE